MSCPKSPVRSVLRFRFSSYWTKTPRKIASSRRSLQGAIRVEKWRKGTCGFQPKAHVSASLLNPKKKKKIRKKEKSDYEPLNKIVVLLQPRIIHPARFPAPVRLVDVNANVDRPDPFLGMALDLRDDVLAGHGHPVDFAAQGVDDVAEGFVAGYGVVGVLDEEFDRTGDLAFVSGEAGSVDGDLGWLFGGHCGEGRVCDVLRLAIGYQDGR